MKLEIWSDVVCPWCYIGKRRVEAALAQFPHRDQVEITWRSFELDPSTPRGSELTVEQMLAQKYGGTPAQMRQMTERVTQVAAEDGLEYHLEKAHPENTFDAHRLLHLAKDRGLQLALKERLLKAYFTEARRVGEPDVLAALAIEVGLEEAEVRAVLADPQRYTREVREDQQRAQQLGIRGVPFVVIDGKYGVSGAQPVEVFAGALERAWAESKPALSVIASGETCDETGCEVPGAGEPTGRGDAPRG